MAWGWYLLLPECQCGHHREIGGGDLYTQISDEMKKMLEADARTFLMKLQSDTFEITMQL